MKISTIHFLFLLWFVFLFALPIVMDWHRVESPRLPFKKNIEFNPSWDYNLNYDRYQIVLKYCNEIKPNDTIITLYSHYPRASDIICAGWFNPEGYSFYAPDNLDAKEYMMVCDFDVIQWWTVIDSEEEFMKYKKAGLIK